MNKFERFEELVSKVAHTHIKVSAKGRHIVVTFYNVKAVVSTYKVTDNVAWEVK
jgi:6-phosphogluconolactonase (cycloisomerase 2 family)